MSRAGDIACDGAGARVAIRLIIFDFDGVIADSEVLSNTVLAECVSEAGLPTTLDDAYRLYMGKRVPEIATVAPSHGEMALSKRQRNLLTFHLLSHVQNLFLLTLDCLHQRLPGGRRIFAKFLIV